MMSPSPWESAVPSIWALSCPQEPKVMNYGRFANKRPQPVQEMPIQVQKHETPFDSRYPNAKSAPSMNEISSLCEV